MALLVTAMASRMPRSPEAGGLGLLTTEQAKQILLLVT